MTAAELCRERGWVPGDVLRIRGSVVHQVLQVCDSMVLTRRAIPWETGPVWNEPTEEDDEIIFRQFQKIGHSLIGDMPPRKDWFLNCEWCEL